MKNLVKILTGLISLWIFLDLFVFLFFMVLMLVKSDIDETSDQLFRIQKATAFLAIPLMIFYIAHIFKNNAINKDKKTLWSLSVFFVPTIATPMYWYHDIWRDSSVTDDIHTN
jgi:hypothetical protein